MASRVFPAWFDPATFRHVFRIEPHGMGLAEIRYVASSRDSDSLEISLEYADHDRLRRVEIMRTIRDIGSTKVAEHVGFYVLDDPPHTSLLFRRKGLAKYHYRRILPLYDEIGVTLIQLAAADAGRVVWPAFGFQIDSSNRAAFENELIGLQFALTGERAERRSLPVRGPDILNYFVEGRNIGKMVLQSRPAWLMHMDLTDPAQREILEAKCRTSTTTR